MIWDELSNFSTYRALAPEVWGEIEEFIRECGAAAPAPGRYEIRGSEIFANVQCADLHPFEEPRFEYHRRYADIQLLLVGAEQLYACGGAKPGQEFDEKADCAFQSGTRECSAMVPLAPGNFVLLLPGELHQPCVGPAGESVCKVVVKVAASLLEGAQR